MSVKHSTSALAIMLLIASTAHGGAQQAGRAVEVAQVPPGAGASVPRDFGLPQPAAASPAPAASAEFESGSLAENAWDFTKPDTIPGFGSLPPGYDSRSVLPKISGE